MTLLNISPLVLFVGYLFELDNKLKISSTGKYSVAPGDSTPSVEVKYGYMLRGGVFQISRYYEVQWVYVSATTKEKKYMSVYASCRNSSLYFVSSVLRSRVGIVQGAGLGGP